MVLTIGGAKKVSGKIMGIEFVEKLSKVEKITEKLLTLHQDDGMITKYNFSEIKSLEIINDEIKKDLKFFLDTVIAGKKKDAKKIMINCLVFLRLHCKPFLLVLQVMYFFYLRSNL